LNSLFWVLLLVGTVRCSVPLSRPKALAPVPPDTPVRAEMARLLRESQTAFHAGEWERAATLFRQGYEISSRAGERRVAVRCLSNLGACRLAQHRTREALDILLEALPVARAAGDDSLAGTLEFNISSLYTGLSERETAVRYAEMALRDLRGEERRQHLPKLLIHLGTLRAQQGRMAEALELFRQGIQGADAAADLEAYTTGCSRLGEAYLQRGDLARAEPPLLEAFRIRKLDRLPALESSYRDLGQLRLAQGDYRSAFSLLDAAIERSARPGSPLPSWDLYQARGRALLALGHAREALPDLRTALRLLRSWRRAAPPGDRTRIRIESWLQQVYAALVEAGAQRYFATGDAALARETFEAAEENRAASLRALLAESHGGSPDVSDLLAHTRHTLAPDEVYVGFYLGETQSYAWAVSREEILLRRLPPRASLADRVGRFRQAVEDGDPSAVAQGEALFQALFGALEPRIRHKRRWLLALDESLFQLPFAALVTGRPGGAPLYLGERQAVQIAAGAGLLAAGARSCCQGVFLGVGDGIYNQADPRWSGPRRVSPVNGAPLARLPGSAREIESCARAWSAAPQAAVLLTGAVSRESLAAAFARHPAVVHFATHVVSSPGPGQDGSIVLGLTPSGHLDLLRPADISALHGQADLVVLSGCSSGVAESLPGTGLLGLTRAWLAAGAGAVIASAWPTPDDSGQFFVAVYRHLREAPAEGPAAALQKARAEMIQSHSWRSQPRYWGSYFLMANQ